MVADVQFLQCTDECDHKASASGGKFQSRAALRVIAGTLFDSLCKPGYREFQNPIANGSVGGIVVRSDL